MNRPDILGCTIAALTRKGAVNAVMERIQRGGGGYVCFANVHTVSTANHDAMLRDAINESFLSLPDGRPIYWLTKLKSDEPCEQVAGPEFFSLMLKEGIAVGLRHFFIGGRPAVLEGMMERIKANFKGINVVGFESPPFRPMQADEIDSLLKRVKALRPDIIWVGLGAPKQELWMHKYAQELSPAVLMGVGAAFDFHAGAVRRAPAILSYLGLEWTYRLWQEPRRLWRRYAVTNTVFMYLVARELLLGTRRRREQ